MALSEEAEMNRCQNFRDEAFKSHPSVRFMFKHLKRGGCELSPERVICKRCDGQLAGGFQDDGGILLCSNHLTTQEHTSNTLVHEAVHAFDQCRAKIDWANCVHHACSEIRAAALSGDCSFGREVFLRRNFGFAKQFQRCVKRRAELSVSLNPFCQGVATKLAVQQAWDACFNDTAPFEKLP
ncbi:unnamed protein product [Agarophyton chilense]